MKYETPPFRDPALYGVPVFSIGIDEKVSYEGQYIRHRVTNSVEKGKNRVYWILTVGFVSIYAKHRYYDYVLPVVVNGMPCPTIAEVISNKEDYVFLEDAKPIKELEVPYDSIVNLDEVTNHKSPALVIDPHRILSHIPRDIFKKYNDLLNTNKVLQETVYEMSVKLSELSHQVEIYHAEQTVLHSLLEEMMNKYRLMVASLKELKLRLLESKDRQHYLEKALKNATAGKEKWELLSAELMNMSSKFTEMVSSLDNTLRKLEDLMVKVEEHKIRLSEGGGDEQDDNVRDK